ncbi:MAG: outer membrane protein assembly factor BamE [Burkholderiaceae bacterium]
MNTTRRSVALRCIIQSFFQRLDLRRFKLVLAGGACALIVACGSFPYKVEVTQGNFVSKEQVTALKTGMPRAQVMDILGTPLLVSVFHADRWEYVFTLKRQGVESKPYKLTVFFKGDLLDKVDGSDMPTEQEFVDALSANKSSAKPPVLEMTEQELKATEKPAKAVATDPSVVPAGTAASYPALESSPK